MSRARQAAGAFDRDAFDEAYAVMAAQRNSKILGIFVRLDRRDGKPAYLKHLPRIRDYLRRAFAHPALAADARLLRPPRLHRGAFAMSSGKAPRTAMVLAAGLGTRLRPITNTMPKPLVPIAGKTLLDRGLDALAAAGVEKAVVNVHHFPDQIRRHVAARTAPRIVISDESAELLGFGRRHRQGAAAARRRSLLPPQRRYVLDRPRGLQS